MNGVWTALATSYGVASEASVVKEVGRKWTKFIRTLTLKLERERERGY